MKNITVTKKKILENNQVILKTLKDEYDKEWNELVLPYLTDKELMVRYEQIQPIVSMNHKYYSLNPYDINALRTRNYLWNAEKDIQEEIAASTIETLDEYMCYYRNYTGISYPPIADILQQMPYHLLDEANGFYAIDTNFPHLSINTLYQLEDYGKVKVRAIKRSKL